MDNNNRDEYEIEDTILDDIRLLEEGKVAVETAMQELDIAQADIIRLRIEKEMDFDEIADKLDTVPDLVRRLFYDGLVQIRAINKINHYTFPDELGGE